MQITSAMSGGAPHEEKTDDSREPYRNITININEPNKQELISCFIIYYPTKYPADYEIDYQLLSELWNCCCGYFYRISMTTKIEVDIPKNSKKLEIEQLIKSKIVEQFSTSSNPIIAKNIKIQSIFSSDIEDTYIIKSRAGFFAWKE